MRTERIWILVGILATGALVAGLVAALPAHSQSVTVAQTAVDSVEEGFGYQGYLTDDNGAPLTGTYDMTFRLYTASSGGAPVYESGSTSVSVDNGLFKVDIGAPQSVFDGQALWLGIEIEGEVLSPRQAIQAAPYAMSLRPGAVVRNAATGTALHVESQDLALYGSGENFGVYGHNEHGNDGLGYGGYFESSTGVGVHGSTTAVPALTNSLPAGVYGYSENGAGIFGAAGQFAWSGYFDGHVRIDGSLVVSDSIFANDKSGFVMDIALNDGPEALERGDLVVVSGVADAVIGDLPVPLVRRADVEGSTAVIGVVDRRYHEDAVVRARMEDRPIAPGEYLGLVTLGAYRALKADASYGAIAPGDLLVASPTPGHAMRADDPATGAVVGKALGALEEGTGSIAVMVTLQ